MSIEILAQVIYKKNIDLVVGGKLDKDNLFTNMQQDMESLMAFIKGFEETSPKEVSSTNLDLNCPICGKGDWFEDNRQKKLSDPKFAKIPVFSCSEYKDNKGCGWKTWDEDVLPSMMKGFVKPMEPVAKKVDDENVAPF